jgi:hypothetical protein
LTAVFWEGFEFPTIPEILNDEFWGKELASPLIDEKFIISLLENAHCGDLREWILLVFKEGKYEKWEQIAMHAT